MHRGPALNPYPKCGYLHELLADISGNPRRNPELKTGDLTALLAALTRQAGVAPLPVLLHR